MHINLYPLLNCVTVSVWSAIGTVICPYLLKPQQMVFLYMCVAQVCPYPDDTAAVNELKTGGVLGNFLGTISESRF